MLNKTPQWFVISMFMFYHNSPNRFTELYTNLWHNMLIIKAQMTCKIIRSKVKNIIFQSDISQKRLGTLSWNLCQLLLIYISTLTKKTGHWESLRTSSKLRLKMAYFSLRSLRSQLCASLLSNICTLNLPIEA